MNYPEHKKLQAVEAESRAISEFFEWLEAEGILLAKSDGRELGWYVPIHDSPEKVLSRFFNIDLSALEAEKRSMLSRLPVL